MIAYLVVPVKTALMVAKAKIFLMEKTVMIY
jgi:hypothetical protein